jgi:dimethylaniline monooxygenase (N-oxide forming)
MLLPQVWLRRSICIGPRYLVKDDEMTQIAANKMSDFPANGFLEAATTNRMNANQNVYTYGFFRRLLWWTPVLNSTLSRMCLDSTEQAYLRNDQATYVTKNQRMCEALHRGKIEVLVTPAVSAQAQVVTFEMPDGTTLQRHFDAVVYATGFRSDFSWIQLPENSHPSSNPRSWFLHCFPEDHGHHLFFLGFARPHQGGVPAMAEMLSRYIALLLSGQRHLPRDYASQARQHAVAEREYYSLSPDLNTLVDYNAFLESVARRIGCEPRLPLSCLLAFKVHMIVVLLVALRTCTPAIMLHLSARVALILYLASLAGLFVPHNGMLMKWWFYPHWSMWYRQRGPGAHPALLEDVLDRVNLWRSTAITSGFVMLVCWSVPMFYLQWWLSLLLFVPLGVLSHFGVHVSQSHGGLLRPKMFVLHGCPWRMSDLFLP